MARSMWPSDDRENKKTHISRVNFKMDDGMPTTMVKIGPSDHMVKTEDSDFKAQWPM